MTVDVSLRSLVRTPYDLATYLHGTGWRQVGSTSSESLWLGDFGDGDPWEVLLPLDPERTDAVRRLEELLTVLEAVERREREPILRDLRTPMSDVLRLSTPSTVVPAGAALMEDALEFIAASRELLLSAAATVDNQRPVLGPRKSDQALAFVRNLRLSTEPGSFVVALEAPMTPDLQGAEVLAEAGGERDPEALFPAPEVPFARRATERLALALDGVLSASARVAGGDAGVSTFDEAVPFGVSANLLEALVRLSGAAEPSADQPRPRDVAVRVRWSFGRAQPKTARTSFRFTSDAIPMLAAAATSLRAREPEPDVTLVGQVTGLRRDDQASTDPVTLSAAVGESRATRVRPVRLLLDDEMHSRAIRAYESRSPVRVTGDLTGTHTLTMLPVRSFDVLTDSDRANG